MNKEIAIRLALEEVVDIVDAGWLEAFHFFCYCLEGFSSKNIFHRGGEMGGPPAEFKCSARARNAHVSTPLM